MRSSIRSFSPLLAGCVALLAACEDGTGVPRPASIQAVSSLTQNAAPATEVPEVPMVRVLDSRGHPLANVGVTFAVVSGGGAVSVSLATTDAGGLASAGRWTLGPSMGGNSLTATVAGLAPVTFAATAADPCSFSIPYTLYTTLQANLSTRDCRTEGGEYVDFYDIHLAQAQGVTLRMTSTAVDAYLELYDATGNPVGFDDDGDGSTRHAELQIFAPAGRYLLGATSYDAGETGFYALTSSPLSQNVACSVPWLLPGLLLQQTIDTGDCAWEGYYSDVYLTILRPGQRVSVAMGSSAVDAWLGLFTSDGILVASDDDGGTGTNAQLTFTSPGWGVYYLEAGTAFPGETGAYTLAFSATGASVEEGPRARLDPTDAEVLRAGAKGPMPELARLRPGRR